MLSGMAVPTAANSEPVTPSEIFSFSPRCSNALVKISAAMRITNSMPTSSTYIMTSTIPPCGFQTVVTRGDACRKHETPPLLYATA